MIIFSTIKTLINKKFIRSFSVTKFSAKIIDGKALAKEVLNEVKVEIDSMVRLGKKIPKLAAILVGNDPASKTYVRNKIKAAMETGIASETLHLNENISQNELFNRIDLLNNDPSVDGILIQLPLPTHINERAACNRVAPEKDVDGFHVVNVGRFCVDQESIVPATPAGVMELIKRAGIETIGKNAVVCGRSKNVGMPISMLLHAHQTGDATTTICHRFTPKERLKSLCLIADLIIVAVGIPKLITADMVSEGVCVIDVGVNRLKDPTTNKYRLVGDVDFEEVSKKASLITPVPGGVGPMTVAMLMKNTLKVAKKHVSYDHCWGLQRSFINNPEKDSLDSFANLQSQNNEKDSFINQSIYNENDKRKKSVVFKNNETILTDDVKTLTTLTNLEHDKQSIYNRSNLLHSISIDMCGLKTEPNRSIVKSKYEEESDRHLWSFYPEYVKAK